MGQETWERVYGTARKRWGARGGRSGAKVGYVSRHALHERNRLNSSAPSTCSRNASSVILEGKKKKIIPRFSREKGGGGGISPSVTCSKMPVGLLETQSWGGGGIP